MRGFFYFLLDKVLFYKYTYTMKKKICKYCKTTKNLYVDNTQRIYCIYNKCRPKLLQKKARKAKKTIYKRYGVKNISQLESIKNKKRETTRIHFGVDYPTQSKTVQNTIIQNNLKKRHYTNVSQDPEIKKLKKQSSIEKFGTACTLQALEIKAKTDKTLLEQYGVNHPLRNKDIEERKEKTNIIRYGVRHPAQNKGVQLKIVETNLITYGVRYPTLNKAIQQKMRLSFKKNNWENLVSRLALKKITPLFSKEYYITHINNFNYQCTLCNKIFTNNETNPARIRCTCTHFRSTYEDAIIKWLVSIHITNIKTNGRHYLDKEYKYEIDILLLDYNIGIDFHGLYWHSDLYKDRKYHSDKYKFFKERNIQLIQIFENEWRNKQDIVKSIIMSKLKLNNVIPARKCVIKEVSNKDAKSFLISNHLQESCPSKIRFGLYYNNELVSLMTFGKKRFGDKQHYELLRYANKLFTTVIGGFQKLLKQYERTIAIPLVSYVDIRYFNANSYTSSGFRQDSITPPNYFYFKANEGILYNRIQFQKHKLKNKLVIFDPQLSEPQNMFNNGYLRIFDAGNIKLVKEF